MKNINNTFKLVLILSGLFVLLGAVILVQRTQELRRRAYYGGVTASVLPSTKKVNVGDTFQMRLKFVPNDGDQIYYINGIDLHLQFDPQIIEATNVEFDSVFQGMPKLQEANHSGKLRLLGVTTLDREYLHAEPFDYAVITFKAKKTGQTEIGQTGSYEIVGSRGEVGDIDRTLSLESFSNAVIEVVDTEEIGALMSLHPASLNVSSGKEFSLDIRINTESKVVIATTKLKFDPSKLEVVGLEGSPLFANKPIADFDNQKGELTLKQGTGGEQSAPDGVIDFGKVRFKAIGANGVTTEVNFDTPNTSIASIDEVYLDFIAAGSKVNIVDSTTPEDWPVLKFDIKFAGTSYLVNDQPKIVDDIGTQKVEVSVRGNQISKTYENVPVEFNNQAVGTGEVELVGVQPGDNYAVLIKGPVHLAKRYCRDGQTGHCWLGEEDVSLNVGENKFDWTEFVLEPGDINRDGVVNSVDFSLLKAGLGKRGDVAEDINFNGVVNTQDIVFFLETLSTKYEDEI